MSRKSKEKCMFQKKESVNSRSFWDILPLIRL